VQWNIKGHEDNSMKVGRSRFVDFVIPNHSYLPILGNNCATNHIVWSNDFKIKLIEYLFGGMHDAQPPKT
jgi:hypothetical protein